MRSPALGGIRTQDLLSTVSALNYSSASHTAPVNTYNTKMSCIKTPSRQREKSCVIWNNNLSLRALALPLIGHRLLNEHLFKITAHLIPF